MSPTLFQVGEIRGYARLQPPAGVGEMLTSCHRLRRRRMAVDVLRSAGAGHRLPGYYRCATDIVFRGDHVLQGCTFGTHFSIYCRSGHNFVSARYDQARHLVAF